jgi:hypothetical protein
MAIPWTGRNAIRIGAGFVATLGLTWLTSGCAAMREMRQETVARQERSCGPAEGNPQYAACTRELRMRELPDWRN